MSAARAPDRLRGRSLHLGLLLLLAPGARVASAEYVTSPEAHGAVGDGKANDWVPIQKAVSACSAHPSCRVVFARRYLSGPIQVASSGVTLEVSGRLAMLPKSQYLRTVADTQKYSGFITTSTEASLAGPRCNLSTGVGSEHGLSTCLSDLRISGGGTITSTSPQEWWVCKVTGCWRPHLLVISSVRNFTMDDVHLRSSPNHHMEVCDSVLVRLTRLRVDSPPLSPNTDGVNFYGGYDQLLADSVIRNGDDCVSVVPTGDPSSARCVRHPATCRGGSVVVRNVTCRGGHGLSVGGVRHGTVSNVTFENITATSGPTQDRYATGGLRIKSYPNGTGSVSGVAYRDIVLDGVYLPLQLLASYCPWPKSCREGSTSVTFSDISFTNIRGTSRADGKIWRHDAPQGSFECSALAPCSRISLTNVVLGGERSGSLPPYTCEHASVTFDTSSSPRGCSSSGGSNSGPAVAAKPLGFETMI